MFSRAARSPTSRYRGIGSSKTWDISSSYSTKLCATAILIFAVGISNASVDVSKGEVFSSLKCRGKQRVEKPVSLSACFDLCNRKDCGGFVFDMTKGRNPRCRIFNSCTKTVKEDSRGAMLFTNFNGEGTTDGTEDYSFYVDSYCNGAPSRILSDKTLQECESECASDSCAGFSFKSSVDSDDDSICTLWSTCSNQVPANSPEDVVLFLPSRATAKPLQGVFLLSNQPENEVAVYESQGDGRLVYHQSYETGGIGYPDPGDPMNLDDLGSSDGISYHVWAGKQWLIAVNPGGPDGDSSFTLFEILPDLTLERKAVQPLTGVFPCTAAGFKNKACVVSCAANVQMDCFTISRQGVLTPSFSHDFEADLPFPDGRPNRVSAAAGAAHIRFSPSGNAVAVLMKGTAVFEDLTDDEIEALNHPAGLQVFPIVNDEYQDPYLIPMEPLRVPFSFTFHPGFTEEGSILVVVANIAGESLDFPTCDMVFPAVCKSTITSYTSSIADGTYSQIANEPVNSFDACWIRYADGYVYTGNFASDAISVATALPDGTVQAIRNLPTGLLSVPNDIVITGEKYWSKQRFVYTHNQGTNQIGTYLIQPGGVLRPMFPAEVPRTWIGSQGLAATSVSEEKLYKMYGYDEGR